MKVFIMTVFAFHLLYGQTVYQKMIISAQMQTGKAVQSFYEIGKFFQENLQAKALKEKERLSLEMELLEPYVLVSIKPIKTVDVKNRLHYLLQEKFPNNFIVEDTDKVIKSRDEKRKESIKTISSKQKKEIKNSTHSKMNQNRDVPVQMRKYYMKIKQWRETFDREWLGLFFLAFAGLLLVYRSARQMSKIRSLQEQVSTYQSKVKGEIEKMGEKYA